MIFGAAFLFSAELVNDVDHVFFRLHTGLLSGHGSIGTNLFPLPLALVAAQGFAHELAPGAVLLPGEGLGLLKEWRKESDRYDFGGSHPT